MAIKIWIASYLIQFGNFHAIHFVYASNVGHGFLKNGSNLDLRYISSLASWFCAMKMSTGLLLASAGG
ncbi:quinone oxidoreductase 2 [Gossypium arboreum]|uniref:Quinone oxidoreductase 2 n=1 Tax=Gossypium arboreum TaxID=29729 RepID=A0A0B0PRD3_GOSAR|nr:quinone oxidoreductase 2 [Gossypium arboreum]